MGAGGLFLETQWCVMYFFPSTKVSWTEGRLMGLQSKRNRGHKEARSAGTGPQNVCAVGSNAGWSEVGYCLLTLQFRGGNPWWCRIDVLCWQGDPFVQNVLGFFYHCLLRWNKPLPNPLEFQMSWTFLWLNQHTKVSLSKLNTSKASLCGHKFYFQINNE